MRKPSPPKKIARTPQNPLGFTPFGLAIYERMSTLGWTQGQLAKRSGLERTLINKGMRGACAVTPQVADAIAVALGIDTNELRRLAGLPLVQVTRCDDRIEALVHRLTRLPEVQREAVLGQVEALLDQAEGEVANR